MNITPPFYNFCFRSAQVFNLYEYKIPERDYQSNLCQIRMELIHPDVLGVYELQLSLMLRVLIELGCVWRVKQKVRIELSGLLQCVP